MEVLINGRFATQPLTGVQRVAHEITQAIDRLLDEPSFRTLRVRLVVPAGTRLPYALRNIILTHSGGGAGNWWEQAILPRHIGKAILLCLGNSAPISSLLRRQPTMVMLHDQAYRQFPDDYSFGYRLAHHFIESLILRRSDIVLSVSEAERTVLLSNNKINGQVMVAPNGSWIHDTVAPAIRSGPPSEGYGLYIGSFTRRKNIEAVMATAIALARQRRRPFRFVGPPNPMSYAEAAAVPEDVKDLIRFDGYVADHELAELYHGADFLLYPSFYEASGLPPSEAMTFGCPVILSDLPVMRERCGVAALYCAPSDHQAIIAAACRILDEPELARSLSSLGRDQAATFTWEGQAKIILDVATTIKIAPTPKARSPLIRWRASEARQATVRRPAAK
ncbi:glycosyltransferase family 1 protein [Sphingomonas sp. BIUV-7]|uniref:Glycosyltransferase family 1 protein n=1 Tax=Sphingomonas natans TaxID=3063330 RepID=A0ABT8YCV0_9SPHN|nr:glycosyltransferase family 1 protein [Sphingomonas sp. BIUV-7]MDO6416162.1 glycosyltransferase family 1 protein [Sphingomonas sp. BIUV-7]